MTAIVSLATVASCSDDETAISQEKTQVPRVNRLLGGIGLFF